MVNAKFGAISLFVVTALAAVYLAQYSWLALMAGLVLGCIGHLMWTWGWLEFLNQPSPWRALRWELANFRNIVLGNRRASWDSLYEAGDYGIMVATAPEPRHYLIAGMVHVIRGISTNSTNTRIYSLIRCEAVIGI